MAAISLILVSHNKPRFVGEAIDSVLAQTFRDWEMILVDSGVLLGRGFFTDLDDPRVTVLPSEETTDLARHVNMASWCFNRVLAGGRCSGELIFYLCDDDLLYPNAFDTAWNYYVQHDRVPQAIYMSQDIGVTDANGETRIVGQRRADRPAGAFCNGRPLDRHVDYLQFCHTSALLERLAETQGHREFHPESKRVAHHADGIFMERMGHLAEVHSVDVVTSMNRRTAESVNLPQRVRRFTGLARAARLWWNDTLYRVGL